MQQQKMTIGKIEMPFKKEIQSINKTHEVMLNSSFWTPFDRVVKGYTFTAEELLKAAKSLIMFQESNCIKA